MNFRPLNILALFFTLLCTSASAQTDTSRGYSPAKDTLRATKSDTTGGMRPGGVDTVVNYSAKDSIIYSMRTRYMYLYGQSDLQYQTMGLKAERVNINWDTATLVATGVKDTATTKRDTTVGAPILKDGGEEFFGSRVTYNFRSKKGRVTLAKTEMEQGYYRGEEIKKVEPDVLFVKNGYYTTCDASHPHFYFFSPTMKLIVHDKIVVEPVYFYVADVPLLALPFGVFPSRGGRASGIIPPAYGDDNRRGKFFSHFGYYWAMNDYMDLSTTFDWYLRGGWLNHTLFQYRQQYTFSGSINANVANTYEGQPGDPGRTEQHDYHINWSHSQTINPTTRLDVNFTFATGSYFSRFSNDLNQILQQNIVSNATFSKTWESSNSNLSVNIYRDQNLVTGAINENLPSATFTTPQFFPFRTKTKTRGTSTEFSSEPAWYELIGLSYNAQGLNNVAKDVRTVKSLVNPLQDSTQVITNSQRYGIQHQVGLSIAPKLGYFTVSPFVTYNEKWYDRRIERDPFRSDTLYGFQAVRTYSLGVSASTRFYGLFQPNVLGITGFRHTVIPSATFSYSPDFSTPPFGYYKTYVDTSGRTVKYGLYDQEVFGGPGQGRVQSLSFSVSNLFEMKYQPADTSKEEKVQLLNLGASASYNFAADSLNLSPLFMNYRTEIGRYLTIDASTTHNFYVFDPVAGTRVNRFLFSETGKIADLTSFTIRLSTSLKGEKKHQTATASTPESVRREQEQASGTAAAQPGRIFRGLNEFEEADFSIPWSLGLNYTFSQFQEDPRFKTRTSSINANLSFNLTDKWQVTTGASYDFVQKQFAAPSVNITRDLHCWTMDFSWFPMGFYRGYRFEIRVKAPQLQDLKVTKQGSQRFYQ